MEYQIIYATSLSGLANSLATYAEEGWLVQGVPFEISNQTDGYRVCALIYKAV